MHFEGKKENWCAEELSETRIIGFRTYAEVFRANGEEKGGNQDELGFPFFAFLPEEEGGGFEFEQKRRDKITRRLMMEPKPMVRKRPRKESARKAPTRGKKLVAADHKKMRFVP